MTVGGKGVVAEAAARVAAARSTPLVDHQMDFLPFFKLEVDGVGECSLE